MAARGGRGAGGANSGREDRECDGASRTTAAAMQLTSATRKTTESMDSSLDVDEAAAAATRSRRIPSLLVTRRRSGALRCVGTLLAAAAIAALVTTVAYNATHIGSRLNWIQKYLKENKNLTSMGIRLSDSVTLSPVPERLIDDAKMRVERSHPEPLHSQRLDIFQDGNGNPNSFDKQSTQSSPSPIVKSRRRGEPKSQKIDPHFGNIHPNVDQLSRTMEELPLKNIQTSDNLPSIWSTHENPKFVHPTVEHQNSFGIKRIDSYIHSDSSENTRVMKQKKIASPNSLDEPWGGDFQNKMRTPEKSSVSVGKGESTWLRQIQNSPHENVARTRRDTHQPTLLSADKNDILENEKDLHNIDLDTLNAVYDLSEKKNFRRSTHVGQDFNTPVNSLKEKRIPASQRRLEETRYGGNDDLLKESFPGNLYFHHEELPSTPDIYHMGDLAMELEQEAKYDVDEVSFPLKLKPLRRTKRVRRKIGPLKPDDLNEVEVMMPLREKRVLQEVPVFSPCEEAELLLRDPTFAALFKRLGQCERALRRAEARPFTSQEALEIQKAMELSRLEVGSLRFRAEQAAGAATLAQRHARQTNDNSKAHCSEVLYSIHDKIDRLKFKLTDLTRLLDEKGLTSPPLVVYDMDAPEKKPQMVRVSPISPQSPQVSKSLQQSQFAHSDMSLQPVLRNEMLHQPQFQISYIPPSSDLRYLQTNYPESDQIYPPQLYPPQQQQFQATYPEQVVFNPTYVVQHQPLNQLGQAPSQTQYRLSPMTPEKINPISEYRSADQGQV